MLTLLLKWRHQFLYAWILMINWLGKSMCEWYLDKLLLDLRATIKVRKILQNESLKCLCQSFTYLHLIYSNHVWRYVRKKQTYNPCQIIIQKRALRIISSIIKAIVLSTDIFKFRIYFWISCWWPYVERLSWEVHFGFFLPRTVMYMYMIPDRRVTTRYHCA